MGLVNITLLEQGQSGVDADELNALVIPLQTEVNGKLDNNNFAANAAIACTKTNGSFGSVNISTSSGSITTSTGTLTVGGAAALSSTLAVTGAQTNAAGLKLTESTAPSTAANVGALYTKNDGTQTELYFREESDGDEVQITKGGIVKTLLLGSAVDKVAGYGAQQAATDVFVVANAVFVSTGSTNTLRFLSDANSNPTTLIDVQSVLNSGGVAGNGLKVVGMCKKGDYWAVTVTGASITRVFMYPIGG